MPADSNRTLDPAVTPELFREWRSPRLGRSNPERVNNPVWEWLITTKLNAYSANQLAVEGDLPQPTINTIVADLRDKLASLENAPCESKPL
jgi:hypothetical protein